MGNIIDFNSRKDISNDDSIEFDEIITGDGYLELTAITLLENSGYEISKSGVKALQSDAGFNITGIMGMPELSLLLPDIDPESRQNIINYIGKVYSPDKEIKYIEKKPIPYIVKFIMYVIAGFIVGSIIKLIWR